MRSAYSMLEPVCAFTGANTVANLPPSLFCENPNAPTNKLKCRRTPSQAELKTSKSIFLSMITIFVILLMPWLMLGVRFLDHPHKYWIMGLGVMLHLNTCLFVYTEGVAMGMMYIRSVGCSPVQAWEKEYDVDAAVDAKTEYMDGREERYTDQMEYRDEEEAIQGYDCDEEAMHCQAPIEYEEKGTGLRRISMCDDERDVQGYFEPSGWTRSQARA